MTLTCQQFTAWVSDFLDGELPAEAAGAMQTHACACARCQLVLGSLRETIRLLGDEQMFAMPAGAHERLRKVLATELEEPLLPAPQLATAGGVQTAAGIPAPAPRNRVPVWRMRLVGWAAVVVLIGLAAGLMRWRANAVTTSGWLIDSHCLTAFRTKLGVHPSACLLKCAQQREAVGVVDAKGQFLPFDASGRRKVIQEVKESDKPDHLWVTVHGRRGGTAAAPVLEVEQIELTAPGTK